MKFWIWIKRELANLRKREEKSASQTKITTPNGFTDVKMVRRLVDMVKKTQENEISCNEVYRLLDQYAEMVVRGQDPGEIMPLVKHHLEMCMDCREEYEALLEILYVER
jgi:hypothetical protein